MRSEIRDPRSKIALSLLAAMPKNSYPALFQFLRKMTLEEFEKSLAEAKKNREGNTPDTNAGESRKRRKHHHRDHSHDEQYYRNRSRHSRKDRKKGNEAVSPTIGVAKERLENHHDCTEEVEWVEKESKILCSNSPIEHSVAMPGKRDAWMENSSSLGVEIIQKSSIRQAKPTNLGSSSANLELNIHENELNKHHLQDLTNGKEMVNDLRQESGDESGNHYLDYTFGDDGAGWRMMKLRAVFTRAKETQTPIDEIAIKQYGSLRAFDEAREEEIELERRETYGKGYVSKQRPSGYLFQERKLDTEPQSHSSIPALKKQLSESKVLKHEAKGPPHETYVPMDQTTLNRLKAQWMRAKLRNSADASILEQEYEKAVARFEKIQQSEVVVLDSMESRMFSGRKGEINDVTRRRGRERGQVEDNEDMSVADMLREERCTRNHAGGDYQKFADQIARDGNFKTDIEYLDENANRLAKHVQKSEINLKNAAVSEFQKMSRILSNCPLCYQEGESIPPIAPVVSLATKTYLTLPTEPEISDGGACIIPIQHRTNLLECDDDEWEEIRNFMKSLIRMYHDQGRDVLFYENAANPQRKKHGGMEAVPLPYGLGGTAPAFFKEAILSSDEEWTQHKKIIDTLAKATQGQGKLAFRRNLIKEMPYFHVWFDINGGLGHVVEDSNRWPKGDLFAREVIGGMLDKEPDIVKRQGRWNRGGDLRVDGFRKKWRKFDWTRVLTER